DYYCYSGDDNVF
nr:immunoglobulin light chain junction region [Macaca mulatta]MOW66313.1 immunoglobulin light chain junction region [Macaca mulatta]MOW66339.1 immunoglobulin light chain junction region [Macaca mulatta]MOW66379.1 immunoglobulin light chain junction region [Macaca mulatta]MOW66410.1 immunoglobulin light chain junction region [Macaca mulatta]